MRILLTRLVYDGFWPTIERHGVEAIILEADGTTRSGSDATVTPDDLDVEIALSTYDVFVGGRAQGPAFIGAAMRCPSLRWFHWAGAGYDQAFLTALAQRGARVTTSHANGVSIAEFVMRSVLDELQGAAQWRSAQARQTWETHEFREVEGTTWLVVGLGSIGSGVARRAGALGATVIGCRRTPSDSDPVDRTVTPTELPSVIGLADVVVLAAPRSDDSSHLVDDSFLGAMKPRSILVNVGRGSLVDEEALLVALDRGVPETAVLDVFEHEPLPADHPFWRHPSVRVTPHNTAYGSGRLGRQIRAFVEDLDHVLAGETLTHDVTDLVAGGETGMVN